MKRINFLTLAAVVAVFISSCKGKTEPGKIYMPDMAYSRAVETYAQMDSTRFTTDISDLGDKIYYNAKPVNGTVQKGELFAYTLPNDSAGYALSAQVKNPLPALAGKDSAEAARLFNIYCAICHGEDGKANGPLATSGKIGGVANLALDQYVQMADGTMYHSILYGKNNMGSYASQLSRKQRWQLVQYIRTLQPKPATGTVTAAATTTDSTAAKGK
jgi:mono/diheme cytochrome c family protein